MGKDQEHDYYYRGRGWATPLKDFAHPENATYIFGPEDGNVPRWIREAAKRFIRIPTRECLNLATTVALVLYDRDC
jgi:tRNA(Leu) C34 or U34 (ribose-2'-O)-methylase TrmL